MNSPQYTATCRTCQRPYPCFGEVPPGAAKLECWDCTQTRRFFESPLQFGEHCLEVNVPSPTATEEVSAA